MWGGDKGRDVGRDEARDVGRDKGRSVGRDKVRNVGRDEARDVGRGQGEGCGEGTRGGMWGGVWEGRYDVHIYDHALTVAQTCTPDSMHAPTLTLDSIHAPTLTLDSWVRRNSTRDVNVVGGRLLSLLRSTSSTASDHIRLDTNSLRAAISGWAWSLREGGDNTTIVNQLSGKR